MIEIAIPGRDKPFIITSVVLDYNGTIARDGLLLENAATRIRELSAMADVYILTADTYGTVTRQCEGLGVKIKTFPKAGAALCKEEIVRGLGENVCAIGNGFNDIQMFKASSLSIAVMEKEGVCADLIPHADILVSSPEDALDLLLKTDRLRATLRT
ncbi:MAG: HAD family hydrolase [Clostridiaceae bacterium]|nr:HAD family hydrolase [Clostridiaceae bacterium]